MKKLFAALVGAVALATIGTLAPLSVTPPAYALGNCGPNGHRNAWGRCVFGGQNQAWCLRHTGHVAAYVGYGRRYCY